MLVNVCVRVGEFFPHVFPDLDIIQRLKALGQYWLTNEEWSGWDFDSRLELNQLAFLSHSLANTHSFSSSMDEDLPFLKENEREPARQMGCEMNRVFL